MKTRITIALATVLILGGCRQTPKAATATAPKEDTQQQQDAKIADLEAHQDEIIKAVRQIDAIAEPLGYIMPKIGENPAIKADYDAAMKEWQARVDQLRQQQAKIQEQDAKIKALEQQLAKAPAVPAK